MPRLSSLLSLLAAVVAGGLAGCSNVRDESIAQVTRTADRAAVQPSGAAIRARLASAALDDRQLGGTRGGLSTGSGPIMTFSFQEATYVNHNLTQSIVVPTITVSPGSFAGATTLAGALTPFGNATSAQTSSSTPPIQSIVQAASSTPALQSILNNGLTSVATNLADHGITSTVSNAANNQLIQQMITANIGISGLSQMIRQTLPAMVTNRLAGANSTLR